MGKIKLLDNLTIQKIAAGEVIERPASIVKELIENSLDANSSNIVVEINNGGKSYIRVTDDGDGITDDDLDLAFERHSTSKLSTIDDIYNIISLGFRGEALASISNVSKVQVMTKTKDSLGGIHAVIEEGKVVSKDTVGCPKGTTMIVKDLFYNLPVRKKFLKSDLVEFNHVSDIVYKLALGNYNTSFKLIKDNKVILKTSNNNSLITNIYTILGKDIAKNLISISFEKDDFKLNGYISNNNLYRSNRSHQYLYINNRYINNNIITDAIERQYKSIIPINRFPVFTLFIEMNPGNLDVNIHPTKQEVKFVNQEEVINIISSTIRDSLNPSLVIPRVTFDNTKDVKKQEELPLLFEEPSIDIYKDVVVKDMTTHYKDNENEDDVKYKNPITADYTNHITKKDITSESIEEQVIEIDEIRRDPINEVLLNISPIGVVFSTYILAEDREQDKLYIVDQHAAHERIMYEKFKEEFEKETIVTQQLLVPEVIELTNIEMSNLLENITLYNKLGFDIEEFGSSSIIIRGVPLVFGKPNIKNLFFDILDNLKQDIKSNYEMKIEKIMKIACTKAVKGGDSLSNIEIESLINQLNKCENPHSCPHGRPTMIEITKKDMEKKFLRIN
ncbi:DNA mismatch repair endonuclease MutL [Tissierella sp. MSJ-40]|uniref:DNA mismatch repair protein MutL n=1 Tax=Tissierella simiarum TaxID=2841534 RepID=A0ABS6E3Y9_9FIRM|nr:DNA mismatch repair endonuclease MutL [Tissierella simiarum]MBU5437625.1 DNA mismatch repair endonuclease MutL [Tissierella simiarum]